MTNVAPLITQYSAFYCLPILFWHLLKPPYFPVNMFFCFINFFHLFCTKTSVYPSCSSPVPFQCLFLPSQQPLLFCFCYKRDRDFLEVNKTEHIQLREDELSSFLCIKAERSDPLWWIGFQKKTQALGTGHDPTARSFHK